jgi:hypothetical protein
MNHRTTSRITLAIAASIAGSTLAANPFFPGAEGFGAGPTGTVPAAGWLSTASVYHVTTTADTINAVTGKPAIGTLRGAFYDYANPNSPKQMASNRIVVFDVGGMFQLTQGTLDIKTVNNVYIAGQTAPTPVTVYGNTTQITKSNNTMTSNVVMRYLTFRRGGAVSGNTDAFTFAGGSGAGDTVATNMILDHVSTSWGTDENLSVTNNNTNVTVQYSIIADALRTDHAYGSLIRPQVDSTVSFHHNLYANNASRQARFGTYNAETLTADFRNNVIYNWRDRASYTGGSSEAEQEFTDVNYVGNYLVAGPNTTSNANRAFFIDKNVDSRVYQTGNFIDSDKALNAGGAPNGADIGWSAFQISTPVTDQTFTQMSSPFATASVSTQLAPDGYRQVIDHVGNSWWNREAIDARIINNVKTNTGPTDGIGAPAPNAGELAALLATPTVSRPAGFDTDGDGMPDAWEAQRMLNPLNPADGKLDYDNDQYTNVEEYLNDVGAFPAPYPIVFTPGPNNRFALSANYDANPDPSAVTNWQPSRYDTVLIDTGSALVLDRAQVAGNIVLGKFSGVGGNLNVNGGWLTISNDITIGHASGSVGSVTLTGGLLLVGGTVRGGAGEDNVLSLTIGTLAAAHVDATTLRSTSDGSVGALRNISAVIAPGSVNIAGRMTVTGDLVNESAGRIWIELGGDSAATGFQSAPPAHDNIAVSGVATLDGSLFLSSIGGYEPANLVGHTILTAGAVAGHFNTVSGNQISSSKWLAVTYEETSLKVTATLPGDGDVDGDVDFDDLLALAQGYGESSTTWATGDFTGNGAADFDDLLALAQHYGMALWSDGGIATDPSLASRFEADWMLAQSLVPEPAAAVGALLPLIFRRNRRI